MTTSVDCLSVLRDLVSSADTFDLVAVFFLNAVMMSCLSCFILSSVAGSARGGWLFGVSRKLITSWGFLVDVGVEDAVEVSAVAVATDVVGCDPGDG